MPILESNAFKLMRKPRSTSGGSNVLQRDGTLSELTCELARCLCDVSFLVGCWSDAAIVCRAWTLLSSIRAMKPGWFVGHEAEYNAELSGAKGLLTAVVFACVSLAVDTVGSLNAEYSTSLLNWGTAFAYAVGCRKPLSEFQLTKTRVQASTHQLMRVKRSISELLGWQLHTLDTCEYIARFMKLPPGLRGGMHNHAIDMSSWLCVPCTLAWTPLGTPTEEIALAILEACHAVNEYYGSTKPAAQTSCIDLVKDAVRIVVLSASRGVSYCSVIDDYATGLPSGYSSVSPWCQDSMVTALLRVLVSIQSVTSVHPSCILGKLRQGSLEVFESA